MNNNFVLNRIMSQMKHSKEVEESTEKLEEPSKVLEFKETPLTPEELKQELMKELVPEVRIEPTIIGKEDRVFNGIEEFVGWFLPLKEKFTESQNLPLTTLIQVNSIISIGCGCRRAQRANQANVYFKNFWTNNLATDLPAKVLEVGGFNKIIFSTPEGGKFLEYPK